uniref:Ras-GEF domain-containing protein n=1 Tax=Eptatretus burgeri TaxID=7764 RepID=A0A8C4QIG1_EPTBU
MQMVNNEVLWVRDEVLQEGSEVKRAKLIKFFINVAQQCRKLFAVCSGLSHSSVVRLHGAWDKVSAKQQELYNELQDLFNPSRNMGAYRSALAEASVCPPVIPLYPVLRKDLTFLHDGNHTWVEGLVNFEKLRMIAKEVRQMCRLVSAGKDVTASFRPWCARITFIISLVREINFVQNSRSSCRVHLSPVTFPWPLKALTVLQPV